MAIGGDFNSLLGLNDRIGGQEVQPSEIQPFYVCVIQCRLQEMRSRGAYYTWKNRQGPDHRIYSRLDRTLINEEWLQTVP